MTLGGMAFADIEVSSVLATRRAAAELAIKSIEGTQLGARMDEILARAKQFETWLKGDEA